MCQRLGAVSFRREGYEKPALAYGCLTVIFWPDPFDAEVVTLWNPLVLVLSPGNSGRFPYHQRLDLRCDRFFQWKGWSLVAYLEVLKLYNHKNVYDYSYTKDYTRRITTYQFHLLPSLGLKVNF